MVDHFDVQVIDKDIDTIVDAFGQSNGRNKYFF